MQSLQGHLLIASPHLGDPNFARSVVLMVEHQREGALGLVLNHPSPQTIANIWAELSGKSSDRTDFIYVGGPIEGPLMAIHTTAPMGESEIVPGLWFATHRDHINTLVESAETPFRLFSGYSGWSAGQLEAEMEAGGWITRQASKEDDEKEAGGWLTLSASAEFVFSTEDDELWHMVVRRVGGEILRADRHIRRLPDDPSLN